MGVALHIDQVSLNHILDMGRMCRLDLSVLGTVEIVNIVTLNGLIQERYPQHEDCRQRE